MKILFCTEFFPAPFSDCHTGGTISNVNMMRSIASNHDVGVLSFDSASKKKADFEKEPFEVVIHPTPQWQGTELTLRWVLFVRDQVRNLVKDRGVPDVLVATTSTLSAFDALPEGNHTKRVAIVQAFENFGLFPPRGLSRDTRVSLAKQALIRRFQDGRHLRSADLVFTNSQFMRKMISRRFQILPSHIRVIPQNLDILDEARVQEPRRNTVGFVVNRGLDKGLSFVLELAHKAPGFDFLIYGLTPPNFYTDLPNIKLMGWEKNRVVMFSSAAAWVVPSAWPEPFGRVSIEAQALKRPVLVASTGGLPETVFDHRFCIEGFDTDMWLTRLTEIMKLPSEYIATNAAKIQSRFSSSEHDKVLLTALQDI